MATKPRHHNLGDHPGHTEHSSHTGQRIAAYTHRAGGGGVRQRGVPAATSVNGTVEHNSPTHRSNGRGLGIHSRSASHGSGRGRRGDYDEGGAVGYYQRGGRAHDDDDDYDEGGRVRLARGGDPGKRKDRLMSGHTDSGLSDTGARTGRIGGFQYNAVGSPTMHEATDETPGFRRGGRKRAHHRDGGTAGGMTATPRMDHARRQRGGSAGQSPGTRAGRGATRTPYSSGSSLSPPANDREGRGYEGGGPA